jgi:transcriptional regulator with XRE-family HTH domain
MESLGISSFRQLSQKSGVSRHQIKRIYQGDWSRLTVHHALGLATALNFSWAEMLDFMGLTVQDSLSPPNPYAAEYEHLQRQLEHQSQTLALQIQQEALQQLESWLRNWPKVVYTIHHDRPDLLAAKILPLLRPLEQLLAQWGVQPIGTIGQQLPFNAQYHQLMEGHPLGTPEPFVEVQRPGYTHQGKLLFRAEVIPVKQSL